MHAPQWALTQHFTGCYDGNCKRKKPSMDTLAVAQVQTARCWPANAMHPVVWVTFQHAHCPIAAIIS